MNFIKNSSDAANKQSGRLKMSCSRPLPWIYPTVFETPANDQVFWFDSPTDTQTLIWAQFGLAKPGKIFVATSLVSRSCTRNLCSIYLRPFAVFRMPIRAFPLKIVTFDVRSRTRRDEFLDNLPAPTSSTGDEVEGGQARAWPHSVGFGSDVDDRSSLRSSCIPV